MTHTPRHALPSSFPHPRWRMTWARARLGRAGPGWPRQHHGLCSRNKRGALVRILTHSPRHAIPSFSRPPMAQRAAAQPEPGPAKPGQAGRAARSASAPETKGRELGVTELGRGRIKGPELPAPLRGACENNPYLCSAFVTDSRSQIFQEKKAKLSCRKPTSS